MKKGWLSPQSAQGPVVWSMVIHGALVLSAVALLHFKGKPTENSENYVDLGYETFDAPPPPAEEVRRVVKSPTPTSPVKASAIPDNSPKELQDEKGEVAGTQPAQAETAIGSENNGTAATTPFYKIKPKYPRAALTSGVEGWVLLEIDITEEGEVDNIRVIDGEQRNMFQSEARRAVAQWKYRPFVDASGKSYRKVDHQVRVDFRLNEDEGGGERASL